MSGSLESMRSHNNHTWMLPSQLGILSIGPDLPSKMRVNRMEDIHRKMFATQATYWNVIKHVHPFIRNLSDLRAAVYMCPVNKPYS